MDYTLFTILDGQYVTNVLYPTHLCCEDLIYDVEFGHYTGEPLERYQHDYYLDSEGHRFDHAGFLKDKAIFLEKGARLPEIIITKTIFGVIDDEN